MHHTKVVGVTLTVPIKAKETLDRQARDRSMSSSLWIGKVFDVGFAAICAREKSMPITDADLDAIVGATAVLHAGAGWDIPAIAGGLGVSEEVIANILATWEKYRRGQA